MKLKHIIIGLVSMLGIGAAVGVANIHNSTKEAKAATNGRFSVLIHNDSWWKNDSAEIYATYSSAGEVRITPDSDLVVTNGFSWIEIGGTYYGVVTMEVDTSVFTYGNFYFQRKSPSGDDWGNSGWILSPAKVKDGTSNTVVIDGSNNFTQDWGNYWKITTYSGVTNYSNLSAATKTAYLKSASYSFYPDTPTAPVGYEFVGWYKEPTFVNKWTETSKPTADTVLYAKYAEASAHFVNESGVEGDELTYNTANSQFEGVITTESANEKFYIRKTVDGVNTSYYTLDSYMSSDVAITSGTFVQVKVSGTYVVYLKSDGTIWLQTAEAYLVAYAYAGYFLTNVSCDASGVDLPSGWETCSTRYASLADDVKDYIYNFDVSGKEEGDDIVEMLDRYNLACTNHTTLDRFIKNSSGASRPISANARITLFSISKTAGGAAPIIVAVIAVISLTAIGGYYFLSKNKKKKEN